VNFLFLQGHGGCFQQDSCLLIPNHSDKGKLWLLNLNNLAKEFAKIPKTITIIFFDACRDNLEEPAYKRVLDNAIQNDPMFKY
jgi:hypothetical protein